MDQLILAGGVIVVALLQMIKETEKLTSTQMRILAILLSILIGVIIYLINGNEQLLEVILGTLGISQALYNTGLKFLSNE